MISKIIGWSIVVGFVIVWLAYGVKLFGWRKAFFDCSLVVCVLVIASSAAYLISAPGLP